ncbi:MAG TPA: hypothetical protein VJ732_07580, partial [Bryobacteraceae bacterium]|nr:hypothetical protein [Bryobacteraceae bacterium]
MAHFNQVQARDARLKRLADSIDALAEKEQSYLDHARAIAELRRRAAAELHAICADFVVSLNRFLARSEVSLDPRNFSEESFQEERTQLVQISTRGRILQIEYRAGPDLVSTEEFRIPYTMEGAVRAFNQESLEKSVIEEQLLFYTVEKDR